MDLHLAGRVALVTGGSKGIGRSVALALAKAGASIAICARNPEDLERTAEEIRAAAGVRCLPVPGDVSVLEDCNRFVGTAVEALGRADIFVHCANGPGKSPGTLLTIPDEEWVHHMNLKFFGAVRCCRAVVPHMQKDQWGRIVLIGGINARLVHLNHMDNGPVCAALANFGKQLSAQLIGDGIRVNTVHPAATDTPRRQTDIERLARLRGRSVEEQRADMVAELPMKRLTQPGEIANLVTFLCSDMADAVTGQSIAVDGGIATSIHY